jgi:transcriptional regulator with GAF, ATPase, and Fis domain
MICVSDGPADVRVRARSAGISLIGESPAFLALLRSVERIAPHSAPTVLIRGETGTGKELIARAIHYLGARRDFPFVPVNCGALPELLAENELFGHRPGAYTGASNESIGLLRLAHRGTLFLDEVDSLSAKTQVTLLRFMQDGHFRPLGASKEEHVDVRILAASNRCLEEEMRAGRFRADLFFRLNLISLEVPPLRERQGDVRVLSHYFLKQCAQCYRLPEKRLPDATLSGLGEYAWPGNVRELENLIHRAFLLCDDEELTVTVPAGAPRTSLSVPPVVNAGGIGALSYRAAKSRVLQEFDRMYLTHLMQRTDGNVTKAAQLAGKERRAVGKLLKLNGILRGAGGREN